MRTCMILLTPNSEADAKMTTNRLIDSFPINCSNLIIQVCCKPIFMSPNYCTVFQSRMCTVYYHHKRGLKAASSVLISKQIIKEVLLASAWNGPGNEIYAYRNKECYLRLAVTKCSIIWVISVVVSFTKYTDKLHKLAHHDMSQVLTNFHPKIVLVSELALKTCRNDSIRTMNVSIPTHTWEFRSSVTARL